jgi:hypothetical protein
MGVIVSKVLDSRTTDDGGHLSSALIPVLQVGDSLRTLGQQEPTGIEPLIPDRVADPKMSNFVPHRLTPTR